jgi:glycosyltransferase involved in cell wall biosynthesis
MTTISVVRCCLGDWLLNHLITTVVLAESGAVTMRIVHLINGLSTGGAEMMLYKLLSAMNREQFDPVVVSLTKHGALEERIKKLCVPIQSIGIQRGLPTPIAVWRLIRTVKHISPDLIQGWQYHGNLAAQLAQMFLKHRVPVLWNIRHSIYDLCQEKRMTAIMVKLGAQLSYKPERVIYVAQVSAIQHEALGYRAEKRLILPNGFDIQHFIPSEQARFQLREELRLSPSTIIIGKIARYHPMKDHTNFLRAAAHLLQSHPDVNFLLAGKNVDRTNSTLMALINELNLGARIHLLGERDDVHRIIAGLDIFSSASYSEGFPNVIGEAMACGVPCVATDVGDSALIIGELGRVVPPKQPETLAEAWRMLIEMGHAERVKLGAMARRHIEEYYSLSSIVSRYEQLYSDIGEKFSALDGRPPKS